MAARALVDIDTREADKYLRQAMKVEVLTVVEDGNPSMEDAVAACVAWINAGRIEQYASGSAAMGMDGLTIYAIPGNRAVVVAKLTEMKYRIVEGGQL